MTTLYLVLLLVLLVVSSFFSATEAAFLSLRQVGLHRMLRRGVRNAQAIAHLAERPERRLLPTILLGNTLVNITIATVATALVLTYFSKQNGVLIATAGVTVLVLVFGEVLPKALAVRRAETVSRITVYPLVWVERLLLPGVFILRGVTNAALRLIGGGDSRRATTEEEVRIMVSAGKEAGTMLYREAQLVENVFRFGDRKVREVMTPRTEVAWAHDGMTGAEFLALYHRDPQRWVPVFKNSIDNVVGVLASKEVLKGMASGELRREDSVTSLTLPPFFTPDTKPLPELLDEMRAAGADLAIAVDEFGGVAGTVSVAQLLEPLVGPLTPEGLEEAQTVFSRDGDTFEVNGDLSVDEANERLQVALPQGDYVTVAGFVLDHLGHIPTEGEQVQVGDFLVRVARMKGRRIVRIQLRRMKTAEETGVGRPEE